MPAPHKTASIRLAEKADAGPLAELGARTFSETYSAIIPAHDLAHYVNKEFSREQMARDIAAPDILLFLAAISDTIYGYIKLQPTPLPEILQAANPIELVRLYISQDRHGHGMGTALIEAGIEAALHKEFKTCWLKVWEGNHKAIAFYKHKGFYQVGDEPYKVATACRRVIVMSRPLEG